MAMIDPNGIMPLNFFKYKGVYTGQHNGMRYMLKQTGEKPDLKLSACVWRGPYASCAVVLSEIPGLYSLQFLPKQLY